MGNLGCMMNCDYCHNWRTSQSKNVSDRDVHHYTPESVVQICLEKKIPIISWTYNDPVVWQEFVVDTAKLARQHGILNLYKSAFYISREAVDELIEHMDVFSLSLKSMDPDFYRRLTKGTLPPVLDAIKAVYQSGKRLEVSNLMVTDANDGESDAAKVSDWVLENCSSQTPLHFVRFHPDYKYTHVTRTPVERLVRAREIALAKGLQYVYLGNVFDHPGTHTYCPSCSKRVISRYGMNTRLEGLERSGCCRFCGTPMPFTALGTSFKPEASPPTVSVKDGKELRHVWQGDIVSFHVQIKNRGNSLAALTVSRENKSGVSLQPPERLEFSPGKVFALWCLDLLQKRACV